MVLIGAYFVLGVASNPAAATYLRNIAAPFLLFQIFALVACRYPVPWIKPLTIIATIATVYGLFEIVAQKEVLRIFNGDVYINWRVRQEYECRRLAARAAGNRPGDAQLSRHAGDRLPQHAA